MLGCAGIFFVLGVIIFILKIHLIVKIRMATEKAMKYDLIDSAFYIVAGLLLGGTIVIFEPGKILTMVLCLIYVGIATLIRNYFFPKDW